jgi:hypothetical protein
LPQDFKGPDLALRFHFYYNPGKGDLEGQQSIVLSPVTSAAH